ncbi:hypothetical protein C8R44DRAFT_883843 [Mycena epipterygia]|nr:hypothetical protein C8R44DRAFT_883843 [Mycena epipterygia]
MPADVVKNPATTTASKWGQIEAGRKAFRSRFSIQLVVLPKETTDKNGEPFDYMVAEHFPSKEWRKNREFLDILADPESYEPKGTNHIPAVEDPFLELYNKADAIRQPDYDAALTRHFDAMQEICVEVRELRRAYPPTGQDRWSRLVDRIITMATQKGGSLFDPYR